MTPEEAADAAKALSDKTFTWSVENVGGDAQLAAPVTEQLRLRLLDAMDIHTYSNPAVFGGVPYDLSDGKVIIEPNQLNAENVEKIKNGMANTNLVLGITPAVEIAQAPEPAPSAPAATPTLLPEDIQKALQAAAAAKDATVAAYEAAKKTPPASAPEPAATPKAVSGPVAGTPDTGTPSGISLASVIAAGAAAPVVVPTPKPPEPVAVTPAPTTPAADPLKETRSAVLGGHPFVIDDFKDTKHNAARVEVANELQNFPMYKNLDKETADRLNTLTHRTGDKVFKKGDSVSLVDEHGKFKDAQLLRATLKDYQGTRELGADAIVGTGTLDNLQSNVTKDKPYANVAQELLHHTSTVPGQLGGKNNPTNLQDNPTKSPRGDLSETARSDFDAVRATLGKLKDYIANSPIKPGPDHDKLSALGAIDPAAPVTHQTVQAIEKAFGLKGDKGIIGPEVSRAIQAIDATIDAGRPLDTAVIHAAAVRGHS